METKHTCKVYAGYCTKKQNINNKMFFKKKTLNHKHTFQGCLILNDKTIL